MTSTIKRSFIALLMTTGMSVPALAKGLNGVCEGSDGKIIKHIKTEQECTEKGGKVIPKKKKGDIAKKETLKPAEVKQDQNTQTGTSQSEQKQ